MHVCTFQVLLALQRLVNVLGPASVGCYPLLLPLIRYAVDPANPESLSLSEDGLCLWLVATRHVPTAGVCWAAGLLQINNTTYCDSMIIHWL